MKILIKNAKILKSADEEIINGQIEIAGNIISKISTEILKENDYDKIINANGNLIMPGFINCHTHSAMTIFKGLGEGKNLQEWLFDNILKYEDKLTDEDVYYAVKLAILEYLKNGITTIADMYYFPLSTAKACYESGMRAYIQLDERSDEKLEELVKGMKNYEGIINRFFGCHSVYRSSEEIFARAIKFSKKYNSFVTTHMSETLTEVGDCAKEHNLTPVGLLESYGFFDVPSMVFHAVHLDKEDFKILERYNVNVCSNPSSNLKLGSGIAPISAMLSHNINVCLGTDGSSSNNKLDMFREMYLVSCLQKQLMRNASSISCEQAIKMATENGATALHNNKIGKLEVGNFADLIMINLHGVNNETAINIKSNLVYASGAEDVMLTMINGKILYENGQYYIDKSPEEIYTKCKEIMKRLEIS